MMSKRVYPLLIFTAVTQVTPIAPPTGCGIRPVPNRNLGHSVRTSLNATPILSLTTLRTIYPEHFSDLQKPGLSITLTHLYFAVLYIYSLVPRLLPYRKTGREPGRTDHVPSDVLCVVLCVVLIIELLPTRSVVVCR